MWHKPEVYVAIRHPFSLAVRERGIGCGELLFSRFKCEVADEVSSHARTPSMSSRKALMEIAKRPWKVPSFTRDDGVAEMGVCEMKRICLEWIDRNRERIDAVLPKETVK